MVLVGCLVRLLVGCVCGYRGVTGGVGLLGTCLIRNAVRSKVVVRIVVYWCYQVLVIDIGDEGGASAVGVCHISRLRDRNS